MFRKTQKRDPYRLTVAKQIGWSGRAVSLASNVTVLTYVTFYCTNILGMDPVLVGTLLLASKVFDGITDLVAGVIIDRTKTRWGKARPYEFAIIGVWLTTVLLFSCPELGTVGMAIWIFVMYSFVNAIFSTLLNSSEAVYLCRAFKYEEDRSKLISVNGLLVTLFCTVVSIVFPTLMATLGTTRGGWTTMMLIIGIPLTVIGLGRFLLVKEVNVDVQSENRPGLKEVLPALKTKYVWILCGITILVNLITNTGNAVGSYYFQYVVGDLGMLGTVGILGLISPFALLVMPKLLQKMSITRLFFWSFIVGIVGKVIKGIAGANLALIMAGNLLTTLAALPPSYFTLMLIIDVMDYHEWKTGSRVEGVIAAINGFSSKVAAGLASGGVGLIMGLCGFDGTAEMISSASMTSIIALYSWIPLALYVVLLVLVHFFDLEKKLPQIRKELAERHADKSNG